MIDHSQEKLSDAIGINYEETKSKIVTLCKKLINKEVDRASYIMEDILSEMSYNELVYMSTEYILMKFEEIQKDRFAQKIIPLLEKLSAETSKEEDDDDDSKDV